jgi:hypothetical protein
MKRPRTYYFLFFLILFFIQNSFYAQTITKSYQFPKFNMLQYEYEGKTIKRLTFDGAIGTEAFPTLPVFWDKIAVNQLYASYQHTLFNAKYEALTAEEIALIPEEYIFNEPKTHIRTTTDEKRYYAMLSVIPIIKNANGQYQKLVSCDISFEGKDPILAAKSGGLRNSVLATGTWYKIAVNSTGLHKVTYEDLKELGISMSELRSANIALYGNGGGMISDINPAVQTDDLLATPIMIKDNGNGIFDENSYFVFYAQGPHAYDYNTTTGKFSHKYNIYSDEAYYFINVDPGMGEKKRVTTQTFLDQTANKTATHFIHYDFYEKDVMNFEEDGRDWFDDPPFSASTSKSYSFTLPEMYDNQSGSVKVRVASTATIITRMDLSWGSNSRQFSLDINKATAKITVYEQNNLNFSSDNLTLTLTYNSSQTSALARLDYIEIQAKCKLKIVGNAMPFAITENIGTSNISSVTLSNATATTVWDVTDPNAVYALTGRFSGSQFTFHTPTDKPRRFLAFNGTEYKSVTPVGKVANQNLHALKNVDMVVISHPDFLSEANRLAQFRAKANNIAVKVVTIEQVYNEFSSGAQDPVAIRNFMRYLYDNDAETLKYLLLVGRPSYDYRGRVTGTQIFIPNFQVARTSDTYLSAGNSCDDFFGVLGVTEGDMSSNTVNIAVGRFPVTTLAQAKIAVDKTINASVRNKIAVQNASQISNLGDWRNMIALVADDEDNNGHVDDAEYVTDILTTNFPSFNLDKIYCDAYPQISYAGGMRYPDVNKAINMRMNRGALAIAYFGHGGGNGWAHERILEIVDINSWTNKYNQPLMITLTCSFGWYDKKAVSPAELVFLNEKGGASSLCTTSRVSSTQNRYGRKLFEELASKWNGRYKTVGEIHKNAKNNSGGTTGASNMIFLIGDPAMTINVPNRKVKTDGLLCDSARRKNQLITTDRVVADTLKALSKVTVKGKVTDDDGNTLSNFNGNIYPSIFDKAVKQTTLGQDAGSNVQEFTVQKNIVFKGNATVTNGAFEFSFYVPKDINFEYGKGKISYYAASNDDDAGGYYDNIIIGGISDNQITDETGPEIALFMNDEKFVPGGITNPDPVLVVKLKDEYGINTTGNGIGHDLVAILDNNIEKQMVLNDYYLADQDSYNSGTVRYPLQGLTPGMHTLKVRAWDICNNPSEASIDFVVKTDEKLILDHVLNYPNPFTTRTEFYFEHNQPAETFDILIHIFTISGKLVKTLRDTQFLEGNRSDALEWDGRDEYGDRIGKGVYLYRLTVRNSQGKTAEKIEKIAIL